MIKLIFIIINYKEIKNLRYKLSRKWTYIKDNESLYLNIIYNLIIKRDKNLTSFFIYRLIFFIFYNRYL